jgi:acyl dehydratase
MSSEVSAEVLSWSSLSKGMRASFDFVVTTSDMLQFAELSGDRNPLHLDGDFARRKGFKDVVVYGGLIVAKISQLIGMKLPGRDSLWTAVALQFRKPLYVGEIARIEASIDHVSDSTRAVSLKLTIRSPDTLVAKGTAEVILVDA